MNSEKTENKYQRQIILNGFGEAGQDKLTQAKVLVIGAGGLGCPALQYLTAAGVGSIGIVDFDAVDLSNLHRQILFTVDDIGKPKAQTAAMRLRRLNPDVDIKVYPFQITNSNALEIIADYDLVLDGSDNYATRYLVNDACVLLNKSLVYGAVLRFEGQVGVFNLENSETKIKTNYRDLFPKPPDAALSLSCSEAGVLGVLPGIIGTLQATEAIKIITGIGKTLANSIRTFNALENSFYEFFISPNEEAFSIIPKTKIEFEAFNYNWFCNSYCDSEITCDEFEELRKTETISIIDVREKGELPLVTGFPAAQIPLSVFSKSIASRPFENKVVLFCQIGKRSLTALKLMKETYPHLMIYSLQGGLERWNNNIKTTADE